MNFKARDDMIGNNQTCLDVLGNYMRSGKDAIMSIT
jgi:hypothetical protein